MSDRTLEQLKLMGIMVQNGQIGMQERARYEVFKYVKERLEKTDTHVTFSPEEVYVVWFCKILDHWKCLLSTTLPDGMYYEVTSNGIKSEIYLDAYKKWNNICIPFDNV